MHHRPAIIIAIGVTFLIMATLLALQPPAAVLAQQPTPEATAPADAAPADTAPADTAPADTAPADTATPDASGALPPEQLSIPDSTCLGCHGSPGTTMTLENGDILGLYVPEEVHAASVHGQQGYACVQCHSRVGDYPHPPFQAADLRDASLQMVGVCARCHQDKFELTEDSVHNAALEAGNRNAAVCTDCHSAHAVQRLNDPNTHELLPEARQWVPQTCAKCHFAIYQVYADSVHGKALFEEKNGDVPTCIDCHGVHNIEDPNTIQFRLRSPETCSDCHTNEQIMSKYGISTQVLETYVADFHGTTVTLFEQQHPDQETNEAVCYDCHGVHNIESVSDPEGGLRMRQNLLARCQACHPNANENFPEAWLSHYIPSPTRYPLVYAVNLFYRIFIPGVLGGMGVLVLMDAGSRYLGRRKRQPFTDGEPTPPPPGPVQVHAADLPTAMQDPPAEAPPAATAPQVEQSEPSVESAPDTEGGETPLNDEQTPPTSDGPSTPDGETRHD